MTHAFLKRLLFIPLLTIIVAELTLRLAGRTPWAPEGPLTRHMHYESPEIGWIKVPGAYPVPGDDDGKMTFLENNERLTNASPSNIQRPVIVLIGDSFAEGADLRDEETFAWKLQQRYPEFEVRNYATSAYSSYQALISLQQAIKRGVKPAFVIYGFIDFHEYRNIAYWDWFRGLAHHSSFGRLALPGCLRKDGELDCYPPRNYPAWFGRETLALVPFFEELYVRFTQPGNVDDKEWITLEIIKGMKAATENVGGKFILVFLDSLNRPASDYESLFKRDEISFLNCIHPRHTDPKLLLPSNQHPNGEINTYWTDCVTAAIKVPS